MSKWKRYGLPVARFERGMTLLEITVAFAIFLTAALAIIQTVSATMVRSEINRELKIAIFDARSVIEEVQSKQFDEICNFQNSVGRIYYPQGPVDIANRLGFDPTNNFEKHLENEAIYIYYFHQPTIAFPDTQGQLLAYTEATMAATHDATVPRFNYYLPITLPLTDPLDGTGWLGAPPDPLRFTVVVFWDTPFIDNTSPTGFIRMRFDLPFMITRNKNDDQ